MFRLRGDALGIVIEKGEYGNRATLTGGWEVGFAELFHKHMIVELEVNQGKGWSGQSLHFLSLMPHLLSFSILDLGIKNIEHIHMLKQLRNLEITTYCNTPIDFSVFAHLERCSLEWRKGAESVFNVGTLKKLFLNAPPLTDCLRLQRLGNLEDLAILNAPLATMRGIGVLSGLSKLRLGNLKKLTDPSEIAELLRLEELEVDSCSGFGSIEFASALRSLRVLVLDNVGPVSSFSPLKSTNRLDTLIFAESTNVLDGDLSFLLHRNLKSIAFQNRRHYSHRREAFGKAYYGS